MKLFKLPTQTKKTTLAPSAQTAFSNFLPPSPQPHLPSHKIFLSASPASVFTSSTEQPTSSFLPAVPQPPTPRATSTSSYFTTMDDAAHVPGPLDAVGAVVPLSVGQEFDCFQDFKAAVHEWAVNSNHSVRLGKSDRSRNVFCCRTSADCEFKVRAIWKANKEKVCCTVTVGLLNMLMVISFVR